MSGWATTTPRFHWRNGALETLEEQLVRSNDNVAYTIFKYMNVDNWIWAGPDTGVRVISVAGPPKDTETVLLRLCIFC